MRFVDPDAIKRGASNVMQAFLRATGTIQRGDSSGHDFHGNQYKAGSGGNAAKDANQANYKTAAGHISSAQHAGSRDFQQAKIGQAIEHIRGMANAASSTHEDNNLRGAVSHLVAARDATNENVYDQHLAAASNSLHIAAGDLL